MIGEKIADGIVKARRLCEKQILSPCGVDNDPLFNGRIGINSEYLLFPWQSRVGCVPGGCSWNGIMVQLTSIPRDR